MSAPPVPAVEAYAGIEARPAPPITEGLPVLGNLVSFVNDTLSLMVAGYRAHGPVFRINLAGAKVHVFAGPEAVRFITKHERTYFSTQGLLDGASKIFECSNECLIVALDGERHRQVRGHQKAPMSRSFFEAHLTEAVALADRYFAALPLSVNMPITAFAKQLIFNQMGQVMAGEYRPELFEPAKVVMDTFVDTLLKPWTNYLPFHPKAKAALGEFQAYADTLQSKARDIDFDRKDLNFTETVFAGAKSGIYKPGDVPMLLTAPYVAGLDTAAHALAFVIYSVLTYPGVAAELRSEIDAVLGEDGAITSESLRRMPRVKGAVMESMRLHPVTAVQTRTALIDFVANGYQIRRGERVLFAATVSHRLPSLFPNPDVFDLHRFDPDRAEHRAPGAYQPYGAGPHTCLGAGVADIILALNLVTILRSYEVELSPRRYHLKVKMIPTPAPVGLSIRFLPRDRVRPPGRARPAV